MSYEFRIYAQSDTDLAFMEANGLKPTRLLNNEGEIIITKDGSPVLRVLPIAPRTKKTAWDADDPERDRFAAFVCNALNAKDQKP